MKFESNQRGVLRAGGWSRGLDGISHVALNEGSASTQFLARSVSRVMKFIEGSER